MLANWFIVGAGPVCFALLPIMLSRSIFNPEPAQVEPTCEEGVLLDVWFLIFVDVGGRFVTGDNPIVPKYDANFSSQYIHYNYRLIHVAFYVKMCFLMKS